MGGDGAPQKPASKDKLRINSEIRTAEVRVLTEDNKQLGVMAIADALKAAEAEGLDLVEISPIATPPVCKIIDYSKLLYQMDRKAKEARKKQSVIEIKEMKFGPKIDGHDFEYRLKHIVDFLEAGDKVKLTVRFRGRELSHTELGFVLVNKVIESVKEIATVEKPPKLEGRSITTVLSPNKKK